MLRDPNGPYKFGRSTRKEGYLLKLKRFCDSEAEVIGVVELMHNGNEAKTNALGRTERSTRKAGKTGMGVLGALACAGCARPALSLKLGPALPLKSVPRCWSRLAPLRLTGGGSPSTNIFRPAQKINRAFLFS
jgi:hypothetical protein